MANKVMNYYESAFQLIKQWNLSKTFLILCVKCKVHRPKFLKRDFGNFLFHSNFNQDFRKFWWNGTRPDSRDHGLSTSFLNGCFDTARSCRVYREERYGHVRTQTIVWLGLREVCWQLEKWSQKTKNTNVVFQRVCETFTTLCSDPPGETVIWEVFGLRTQTTFEKLPIWPIKLQDFLHLVSSCTEEEKV